MVEMKIHQTLNLLFVFHNLLYIFLLMLKLLQLSKRNHHILLLKHNQLDLHYLHHQKQDLLFVCQHFLKIVLLFLNSHL
jgi:hypothetical protein